MNVVNNHRRAFQEGLMRLVSMNSIRFSWKEIERLGVSKEEYVQSLRAVSELIQSELLREEEMPEGKWSVWSYDIFENGDDSDTGDSCFPIDADYTATPRRIKEYDTEKEALERAEAYLVEIELKYPRIDGVQYPVYIQRPDGSRYRLL